MADPPLLALTGIRFHLGDQTILDGVDLGIAPGERLSLVGRNGAGKSTLLRILAGQPIFDGGTRFARDYRLLTRRAGLARDRRTLERACRLAAMLRKNPPPPESAEVCYRIALETFDAMAARPRADCAYFKSLWLILKDGGWGVHEQWFTRLGARQSAAAAILGQPLDAQTTDEETVAKLATDLERWSAGEAHFVLP